AGGLRARSTRSRPTPCMAGGCRFAAASSWRCRPPGPAASGRRSALKRDIPTLRAGLPLRSAVDLSCAAPPRGPFYRVRLGSGGYTPASLGPVGVAAVAGYFVTHGFEALSLGISVG